MRSGTRWQGVAEVLLLIALLITATAQTATYQSQVSAGADDAKTYGSNMETNAANALVGYTGEYVCDYLARFHNVTIPQGATIDSAFLALRCYSTGGGQPCDAVIYFEDVDSAGQFSTYSDYGARTLTSSYVGWDSITAMTAGQWYRTPDISGPLSEVTSRGGWSAGHALAVFIQDDGSSSSAFRRLYQYDGLSSNACSLIVFYDTVSTSSNQLFRRRRTITNVGGQQCGR